MEALYTLNSPPVGSLNPADGQNPYQTLDSYMGLGLC